MSKLSTSARASGLVFLVDWFSFNHTPPYPEVYIDLEGDKGSLCFPSHDQHENPDRMRLVLLRVVAGHQGVSNRNFSVPLKKIWIAQ